MYDIFSMKHNARVRIRKTGSDAIEIKTPMINGNREFIRFFAPGAEWDSFSGVWTATCPDDRVHDLAVALKVRFSCPVAIEEGGSIPLSPTAAYIAPEKKVEIV